MFELHCFVTYKKRVCKIFALSTAEIRVLTIAVSTIKTYEKRIINCLILQHQTAYPQKSVYANFEIHILEIVGKVLTITTNTPCLFIKIVYMFLTLLYHIALSLKKSVCAKFQLRLETGSESNQFVRIFLNTQTYRQVKLNKMHSVKLK